MLKYRDITVQRLDRFTSRDQWKDVNLHAQLYPKVAGGEEYVKLEVFSVPELRRIPFEEAAKGAFDKAEVNQQFGPSWSTHWFRIQVKIPSEWKGEKVEFHWDGNGEGLVWTKHGVPVHGLTGGTGGDRRVEYVLAEEAQGGEEMEFYIEHACNGMFGNGDGISAPDPNRTYRLTTAHLVTVNETAIQLLYDFQVIRAIAKELPKESNQGAKALYTANEIVNAFRREDVESMKRCREIAKEFFKSRNGTSQHRITAVGHCHIDTAWLWPYDETKRKVARSWSTQLRLMEKYPEFTFVCSQAQQYEWLAHYYPELFKQVQEKAKSGQFLPIGGTWVEMDCNVPSGEALCRQFLFGQRFFEKHFGHRCKIFWLPDTFGYSAQLPQIVLQSGLKYFFTQKLSWNNINKFPNTSFYWKGLDGSKVVTHMAPSETYNAQAEVSELLNSVKNNRDLPYTNESLLVFGNGDGGGGPLPAMIERLRRMEDIDGLPKVTMGSANDFYDRLATESRDMVTWKGELYFELHRGTYTSHAKIKKNNRTCELLLREIEMFACMNLLRKNNYQYPQEKLSNLWKSVLLNQFHDVLPGSSIELVYIDARKIYQDVIVEASKLRQEALDALCKEGNEAQNELMVFNSLAWDRTEVLAVEKLTGTQVTGQSSKEGGFNYILAKSVPGASIHPIEVTEVTDPVSITTTSDGSYVMHNKNIAATIDNEGRLISLIDVALDRELVPEGSYGNVFKIFDDCPLYWDAWDVEIYHLEKWDYAGKGEVKLLEEGPIRGVLEVKYQLTPRSTCIQRIILDASSSRLDFECEVEWNENRQFLKVEFPFDISSDFATYETQFGVIQRPTHTNTSWDMAKFEVCGHKFADLSEYGYGVALLNDSKYGYAVHENIMRLSLIRAPKAPDAHCDIGHHEFRYAVYPHRGSFLESDVVRQGYNFNVPLIAKLAATNGIQETSPRAPSCFFTLSNADNVVLDTVKKAEDSDAIVLRFYEAYGGHATLRVNSSLSVRRATSCNILEEEGEELEWNDGLELKFTAFQLRTVKLELN
ncbi:hypothetical protein K493DRAFT_269045 [Basidiobolus meristosporus CBS 931.73]|uniref:Alpha-mannosidase n=1 Tax=Basidiobolus meristosporus CBS 931.73 TaxID=1314790 RepID=A0A1Y1XLF1_9FUNG|nr:hypothetical protein K493DRAFT_269045 [Basidiobolus meristosporus CBS 931.73]|eukprot:ORX86316.1 hypothetical protein K493DRAFT_269045 [Basidiobolus meristosporus CBS 931.73]